MLSKKNIQDIYLLSSMQEGMLFHHMMGEDNGLFVEQVVFEIIGKLDLTAFEESYNKVIEKYDVFRTIFMFGQGGKNLQGVLKERRSTIDYKDKSLLPDDEINRSIDNLIKENANKGFDLRKDIPTRLTVVRIGQETYKVIWEFHHIIIDGWCLPILFNDFFSFYSDIVSGKTMKYEAAKPYADYIHWLKRQNGDEVRSYWKDYLMGYESVTKIPASASRSSKEYSQRHIHEFTIPNDVYHQLCLMTRTHRITMNSLLQTVWGVLLGRYNNTTDIIYGTVVSGRPADLPGVESMVGLFINNIPIRMNYSEDTGFISLANKVQNEFLQSIPYSHLSLAEVQSFSQVGRELINNILVFENYPIEAGLESLGLGSGLTIAFDKSYMVEKTNYDFEIVVTERDNLTVKFRFNANVYDECTARRIGEHFQFIIEQVVRHPTIPIREIEIVTEREREIILSDFNNTKIEYGKHQLIHELFEEQVAKTPYNVAVIYDDKAVNYDEINRKSNQVARFLQKKGIGPDCVVAIVIERSLEMMIGLLAVLKAGGAYLPIDPSYPPKRIALLLEDSKAEVVLTNNELMAGLHIEREVIALDHDDLYHGDDTNLELSCESHNLAYVIYTSGSTGKPKGTMIEHYSVINRLNWMQRKYPICSGDFILQKTPFTFDVSVWELFWWSFTGACVCFLAPGDEKDPAAIIEAIEKYKITTIHFVPSMLTAFMEHLDSRPYAIEKLVHLKQVFTSGEALALQQVKKFNALMNNVNDARLINLYGPTEATVDVSYFDCSDSEELQSVPIGKPIDNLTLYTIDKNNKLQPIGVAGELCIAGDGLARGYLNRPELTNDKFVEDMFVPGRKMYKTGDLARWLPDGNIEYLGRMDHQIKIRGVRIELGEVEEAIKTFRGVKEVAVVPVKTKSDDMTLVACIVNEKNASTFLNGEKRYKLPNNMACVHNNRVETDSLYQEVFTDKIYLKHGIRIKDGDYVFDVGADIGLFTLFASLRCNNVNVFSFEPIPKTYELLSMNVDLYGQNVKTFNCGLSNHSGITDFYYYPNTSIMSSYYGDTDKEKNILVNMIRNHGNEVEHECNDLIKGKIREEHVSCEVKPLSEIVRTHDVQRIDLLKIDVEKSGLDILEGIEECHWNIIRQIVIKFHYSQKELGVLTTLLESKGFFVISNDILVVENQRYYLVYASREFELERTDDEETLSVSETFDDILFSTDKLRDFLGNNLLETMPLTASGKLDRKALMSIDTSMVRDVEFVEPIDELEKELTEVWKDTLGIDSVGIHDNFFELGGHSLRATVLVSRIHKKLGVEVPLREVFSRPSVKSLSEYIRNKDTSTLATIKPVMRMDYYPMSSSQKRMYVINQFEDTQTSYNMPGAVILEGEIDRDNLLYALKQLIQRHEILRTTFLIRDGEPVQCVHETFDFDIAYIDAEEESVDGIINQFIKSFRLDTLPLLRVGLLRLSQHQHILILDIHHIITDGFSLDIMIKEISSLYNGFTLSTPRIQYKDYSSWHNQLLESEKVRKEEEYWLNLFKDEVPELNMPTDYPRPLINNYNGEILYLELDLQRTQKIKRFIVEIGTTMSMALLAVYNVLLSKYTGLEDIVVGVPIAGRTHPDLFEMLGMFVNTLAVKNKCKGDLSFIEFLHIVGENSLESYENQIYPFEKLVEKLGVVSNGTPLFQTMFIMQNTEKSDIRMKGIQVRPYRIKENTSKFDFKLEAFEESGQLTFSLDYNTGLYKKATMVRFLDNVAHIIDQVLENKDIKLYDIGIISDRQKETILFDFNHDLEY